MTIPDIVFITLTMSKEAHEKRLKVRHGDEMPETFLAVMSKFQEMYELPGKDEPNTFNVEITLDMSPDDVLDKVLDIMRNNYE